ncbi:hypothetical protein AB4090_06145 [Acidithiobacillus sp. IBUN Pt1247-S3]|uniref:hypothetical protein n=1 Tax=Acidithiobacillus sp. IBUN Pt1247-S3 TaxID=3166642 RepID=UPI0034E5E70F
MTSQLEDKLNASMQSPRRRSSAKATTTAAEKDAVPASSARTTATKTKREPVADLNAGTGRELNPQRIWPD